MLHICNPGLERVKMKTNELNSFVIFHVGTCFTDKQIASLSKLLPSDVFFDLGWPPCEILLNLVSY